MKYLTNLLRVITRTCRTIALLVVISSSSTTTYAQPSSARAEQTQSALGTSKFTHEYKTDDDFLEMVNKLKTYYEKFKSKWASILADRKKTVK